MLVIAHRGANREALENSRSAYEKAIEGGSDSIELDARLSKDGKVFVLHDESLAYSVGISGKISQLSSQELTTLKLKNGEAIPLLENVLNDFLPQVAFVVELKGPSLALAKHVAEIVQNVKYKEKVTLASFHPQPILYLKHDYPHLRRGYTWSPFDHFVSPVSFNSPQIALRECRTNIIYPRHDLITPAFMDQAKHRGWEVFPWVPKAIDDFQLHKEMNLWSYLRELAIDGLCTNRPRELRQWLNI
ncbi:MAG: glycerophosphodiester phosphodiesterase [Deltaproteobacteria bacterium]|nr:glycerophosphodiester phosphodiesterase [Deltaproteobacteria bacterium]